MMSENNLEFERFGKYTIFGLCVSNIESYGPIFDTSLIENNYTKQYPKKIIRNSFRVFLNEKVNSVINFNTKTRKDLSYPSVIGNN